MGNIISGDDAGENAGDNNMMLAAIFSLLLVILFVVLLHLYARWFLDDHRYRHRRSRRPEARPRRSSHSTTTTYTYDVTSLSSNPNNKGLDPTVIDSIPLFVYDGSDGPDGPLECAICLSVFEEREVGRSLPKCSHGFHVECIDMWLYSQSTCPICRAPVVEVEVEETTEKSGHRGEDVDPTVEMEDDDHGRLSEIVVVENNNQDYDDNQQNHVVSSSQSTTLDFFLRRMLSRSTLENRVYPTFAANVSHA